MLKKIDKNLVIFDEKDETQTAMLRALELARLTQARIHLIATVFSMTNFSEGEMTIETFQL